MGLIRNRCCQCNAKDAPWVIAGSHYCSKCKLKLFGPGRKNG